MSKYCVQSTTGGDTENEKKKLKDILGNGICERETNNKDCGYDGGDCCLEKIKDFDEQEQRRTCSDDECKCHLDDLIHVTSDCKYPERLGNSVCQDEVSMFYKKR